MISEISSTRRKRFLRGAPLYSGCLSWQPAEIEGNEPVQLHGSCFPEVPSVSKRDLV
jgi:hypothetical protein